MRIDELKYKDITREIVDKILYEGIEYNGADAEVVIVPGSNKAPKYRVPKAVELYNAGKVKKILCCGGRKFNEKGEKTEAEAMAEKASELGVSSENIIIENESGSTKENIANALSWIEKNCDMEKLERVIIVTTTFHMKRTLLLARKVFPENIEIIPCPADDINTRRDNWFDNKIGYERAVGEVIGIVDYARKKEIDRFEI